eukprot:11183382-Lingulodinium_polyedra.AAC.1
MAIACATRARARRAVSLPHYRGCRPDAPRAPRVERANNSNIGRAAASGRSARAIALNTQNCSQWCRR